jgi:hypothetical protein
VRIAAAFFLILTCVSAVCPPSAPAQALTQEKRSLSLGKIKQAGTVAIDCSACPNALAKAEDASKKELVDWGRFRIVDDPKKADLIFMFSANPYLGDYLTRKGPDKRVVRIDGVIMTVVDPRTGAELWSDTRRWGSLRVAGGTKALIEELRSDMEAESKKWTVEDIFSCAGTPAYQAFAFLTPEAALKTSGAGVSRIDGAPTRLEVSSNSAPDFCRRARLVIRQDNKIEGFEVLATASDVLDVGEILEQADRYDFTSGRDPQTQRVYFTARSKDKNVFFEFEIQGRRPVLSRVVYSY